MCDVFFFPFSFQSFVPIFDTRACCLQTPLETGSIDVAVFCLSLMGVDYPSFLKEAHRVLKLGYSYHPKLQSAETRTVCLICIVFRVNKSIKESFVKVNKMPSSLSFIVSLVVFQIMKSLVV